MLGSICITSTTERSRCQMKVKVTFEDVIEVEDLEQAYDVMIEYCNEIAKYEDVTGFNFEPLPDKD